MLRPHAGPIGVANLFWRPMEGVLSECMGKRFGMRRRLRLWAAERGWRWGATNMSCEGWREGTWASGVKF